MSEVHAVNFNKYGVNFTASMIIVFKLTIFNIYFVFLIRQIHLKRLLLQRKRFLFIIPNNLSGPTEIV